MGGKAFDNTRRIQKDEIHDTLTWLERNWSAYQVNGGHLQEHLLGSAGKNVDSGDLDLNLRIERYDQTAVADALTELLGPENVKARPGNNQIFTSIPIKGDPTLGRVQVDFMFGDYEWQKFSYYSPGKSDVFHNYWQIQADTSFFKGLYRTEFIKAITAFQSDWVLEDNDEVIARVGPTFFHDKGVVWRYRYRPMRKDGKGRVQDFKEVTEAEFKTEFPSALTATRDVIRDPKDMPSFLFGDERSYQYGRSRTDALSALESLESLWQSCYYAFSPEDRQTIIKIFVERLNNLKADIPVAQFKDLGIKV